MDIQDTRISQLKQWFTNRSFPENEKSYISQLLSKKAPFGERAARRLEKTYGMGSGYLDGDAAAPAPASGASTEKDGLSQGIRLLNLFHRADPWLRGEILRATEELLRASEADNTSATRHDE